MLANYCYWSVATGRYGELMEKCVHTARTAGVFKEFHVLTDRELHGCNCYDALECDTADGLFKLHYLSAGISKLTFDYFVWVDADTVFVRNPVDLLQIMYRSPIHVPLQLSLADLGETVQCHGLACATLSRLYHDGGVLNKPYVCQSAFWVIRRGAIDAVYALAMQFANRLREAGESVSVDAALGYAMQMLCADPEAHLLTRHPEIWASDDLCYFSKDEPAGNPWPWQHPWGTLRLDVNPAIVHLAAGRSFRHSGNAEQSRRRETLPAKPLSL